jgi:hypothetical protein
MMGKDDVYKYVVKGIENGVSEFNLAKNIKVMTPEGTKKLTELIN